MMITARFTDVWRPTTTSVCFMPILPRIVMSALLRRKLGLR